MNLEIESYKRDEWAVVEVDGEVDISNADILRAAITDCHQCGDVNVIVDLSSVPFVDSSGLGVLASGLKSAVHQGGKLRVVVAAEPVRKIFVITGLDGSFELYPTLETALVSQR